MRLWLDDIRLPPQDWVWAKSYDDAILLLANGGIEEISFDHDLWVEPAEASAGGLGGDRGSVSRAGYDVVCWMEANNFWPRLPRCTAPTLSDAGTSCASSSTTATSGRTASTSGNGVPRPRRRKPPGATTRGGCDGSSV